MEPLISVIIPVYKVEKYLDACVESVVAQTLREIEIILVDDGSPDRCGEMCDAWAAKDSRIRVIHQKNQGVSSARNAGLDAATGEYIGFVDPDDVIDPRMYAIMLNKMQQTDVDLVECEPLGCTDKQSFEQVDSLFDSQNQGTAVQMDQTIDADQRFNKTGYLCRMELSVWSKLFRRSVIEQHRIRFQPFQKIASEDGLFCLEYLFNCRRIVHTSQALYAYRQRKWSLTHVPRNEYAKGIVQLIQYLIEFQSQSMERLSRQEKLVIFYCLYKMIFQRKWFSRKEVEYNLRDTRTCSFFSWNMVWYKGTWKDLWNYFLVFYFPLPWVAWLLWTIQGTKNFC